MKVIAIIPIKHVSQRVPGKNYKLMDGKPLYTYIVNTLLQVERIERIIINTDSEYLKKELRIKYPSIEVYMRPEHLLGHTVSVNNILMDTINYLHLEADVFLQTHTTNPLLSSDTINSALDKYEEKKTESSEQSFQCLYLLL